MTIETIYQDALLAAAGYADWNPGGNPDDVLRAKGFTDEQITEFKSDYSIDYFDDNFVNGFAAVVFTNNTTGKKTVSFRGTEPTDFGDLANDVLLALGLQSFADYFGVGQDDSIEEFLMTAGLVDRFGNPLVSPNSVNFVGHSLGGHLATMAAYKYSSLVNQVNTFNGAGLQGWDQIFNDLAGDLSGSTLDTNRVANYFADKGLELTSDSDLWFKRPGAYQPIFIEYDGAIDDVTVANHGVNKLVESLSVYCVLALIDPSLDSNTGFEKIYNILDAASTVSDNSLEEIVERLGNSLGGDLPSNTRDIELFYQALLTGSNLKPAYQGLSISPPVTGSGDVAMAFSAVTLKTNAQISEAWLYALKELNTFVVTGNDAIYISHETGGALDIVNYSDNYLTDRARFLSSKIELGLSDKPAKVGSENVTYIDKAQDDFTLKINRPAGAGQEPHKRIVFTSSQAGEAVLAQGGNRDDRLYGFLGNDILVGSRGSDYLEGGQGDDSLFNNDNLDTLADDGYPDILVGGAGFDTYYAGLNDIIRDSDGQGEIRVNGQPIPLDNLSLVSGTTDLFTNNDPDNPTRLKQISNGDLQIIGSIVTVEGFHNGDLGITLDGSAPIPDHALINGTSGDDLDSDNQSVEGSLADEELHGLGGNDDVFGLGGQDVLFGEGGDDRLISEEGHDVLSGGDGRDLLISKAGKDILMGDAGSDLLVAGTGDDFLDGDKGNDALAGGAGSDSLFGGDGNDVLWGDGTYSMPDRNWNVSVTNPSAHTVIVTLDGIIGEINSSDDQADLLNGGAGNDVLFGAGGNDQLYGGDDSDFLIGGAGDDRLEGGSGDDNLFGDNGSDRALIGNDILLGGDGNDLLEGGYGDDELNGGAGNDEIHGDYTDVPDNGGNDTITAGEGNDIVLAGAGDDVVDAGAGDDYVAAGQGRDAVLAGAGADSITAGDGNDTIFGDAGSDTLQGDAGDDDIDGGDGNDVLFGNDGTDQLTGGAGLDSLLGGAGNDDLSGNGGDDQLRGGGGDDILHGNEGDDDLFGLDGADTLYGDIGNDQLQAGAGNDQLYGGDGADLLFGEGDGDTLSGGDGDDELQGNDGNDVLQGDAGNDLLFGQAGDDVLNGGGGSDDLQGGDGTDFLYGGRDGDSLAGGLGNDTYQYNRGDGADVLFDEGGALDILSLGPDISENDISITTQSKDLIVSLLDNGLPTSDTITLANWFSPDNRIESIQFNDGTAWNVAAIQSKLSEEIALVDGLNAQGSGNVTTYTFTPATDNPDGFNITVTDAGGVDAVRFNQITGASGTATPSLSGYSRDGGDLVLDVAVISEIVDIPRGNGQIRMQDYYTASGFIENIAFPDGNLNDPNSAPSVANAPADKIAALDTAFSYTLSANTFNDSPFDILTFSASLADGSDLPEWLTFDPGTAKLSGTPTTDDSGFLDVAITARDSGGLTATAGLGLNVGNVNVAPVVKAGIEDQVAIESVPYQFTIPDDAFIDRNPEDSLSYMALSADSSALPPWLTFNISTDTFTGTPSQADIGLFNVRVIAEDDAGLSTSDTFIIDVKYFNDSPQIDHSFANQSLVENTPFSFQLPADSFTDPDLSFGDSLSYTAIQKDGTSLPSWLFFNDSSLTFSGTPRGIDSDTTFDVEVIATDKAGLSASNTFQVDVTNTGPSEIREFQLSQLDGTNGFTLQSNEEQDVLGMAVGSAGDINGDGFNDFIVGAPHENVSAGTVNTGRSFVVFGRENGFSANMNISQIDGTNGFRIDGVDIGNPYSSDQLGKSVSGGADFNGDGFDDMIIGEPGYLDADNTAFAGAAYVIYGKESGFDPNIFVTDLNGLNGFKINGELGVHAEFGRCVSNAGDINADGLDDFIVGAFREDKAYVIFGNKAATTPELSVNDINGTNGFVIESQDSSSDNLGFSASTLGDFNGDGIDDLIVGADQAEGLFEETGDPNIDLNYNNGAAYIIYGKDSEFDALLDVNSLDGSDGFTVYGINGGDNIGYSVSGGGDINGDGFDDAIIGAPYDNGVNISNREGASYILFGNQSGFHHEISLTDLDGSNGFKILGAVANNYSGFSVSNAGDVNGDGYSDILIGADNVNVPGEPAYLIYGKANGFAPEINLDALDGINGLVITNQSMDKDRSGRSVAGIGDINEDGFDDLLLGAPYANPGGKNAAGEAHVIFGGDFPDSIDYLGTIGDDAFTITGNNKQIYTLGGNDTVNVSGGSNISINSGAGNDTINLNGVSNADVTTGLGNNTVNISGTSSSGASTTTINTGQRSTTHTSVTTTTNDRYVIVSPGLNGGGGQVYDVYTGQVVNSSDVTLRKGSMIVDILGGQVELHFEGVDTDNLINGTAPFGKININNNLMLTYDYLLSQGFDIDGTVGDDILDGTEITDRINGLGGGDVLRGGKGDDTLSGGEGGDTLNGGAGDDILDGGAGDDILLGGIGDDTYRYRAGDGSDTLDDSSGVDQVVFGAGLSNANLTVERLGDDLIMSFTATDKISVTGWFADSARRVERFVFIDSDLSLLSADEMEALVGINHPPVVAVRIADQATNEDEPFSFTVPADAFTDPDQEDILAYSAAAGSGGPLPDWLAFDAYTRTFSGTPDNNDVGEVNIAVSATDPYGESATDSFRVVVNNINDPPVLANPIQDQSVDQDAPFSFTIPTDTFSDEDSIHGDTQTFSVSLADGGALPAWLQFDRLTRTLSGTPGNADVGVDDIRVTATDSGGLSAPDIFSLFVINVLNGNHRNNSLYGTDARDIINGFGGNDLLFGRAGDDTLKGGNGNDLLFGGEGSDVLAGDQGNDMLLDWSGNDVFAGGAGNDSLFGGTGDDIYEFSLHDGRDRISDAGGDDTLRFSSGIGVDAVDFQRQGRNLLLNIAGRHDGITIDDWYLDESSIERFEFGDGTTLTEKQVQLLVQSMGGFHARKPGHIDHSQRHGEEEQHQWLAVNWNFH